MATIAQPPRAQRRRPLDPDLYERILAFAAAGFLVVMTAALTRGHGQWDQIPLPIWTHLVTIAIALGLTPVMLLRRRGDWLHRRLGWIWSAALVLTALDTFLIRTIRPGSLSIIHLLSAFTLVQVPLLVLAARRHNVKRHRAAVKGLVTGALLIAGCFTLLPSRLLGHWLLG